MSIYMGARWIMLPWPPTIIDLILFLWKIDWKYPLVKSLSMWKVKGHNYPLLEISTQWHPAKATEKKKISIDMTVNDGFIQKPCSHKISALLVKTIASAAMSFALILIYRCLVGWAQWKCVAGCQLHFFLCFFLVFVGHGGGFFTVMEPFGSEASLCLAKDLTDCALQK